jgi:phosphopantothenoylcysteine decarboxylase/phosphopantothenate--cysteine ligase
VLENKNILLGITGSIAVYKSVDLARRLADEGAHVSVVMTESAGRFVSPLTFETALGRPAYTNLFKGYLSHISLVKDSHLLIIAPATANTISKLACGIADNLLTTLWLAYKGPSLIAPAMNSRMYRNPIVKKNIKSLSAMGVQFIGPASGSLACGEEGEGRMSDISGIIEAARFSLSPKDLSGHGILVTAGPTREPLDPVRFISNRSSGKMGFSLAKAASRRGAEVTLISGPTEQIPSGNIRFIPVERAVDMEKAVKKNLPKASVLIMTAAVSDFSPAVEKKRKIPKTDMITLQLTKTPDIIERIGKSKGNRLLIGFAAESGKDIRKAREKLKRKNLDLIVFNDISREGAGFDTDTNIVTLIEKSGKTTDYPLMKKEDVANLILDKVVALKKLKGS